jgi:hypothetical protein
MASLSVTWAAPVDEGVEPCTTASGPVGLPSSAGGDREDEVEGELKKGGMIGGTPQ